MKTLVTGATGKLGKEVVKQLEKIPEIVESQYTLGHYTILIKLCHQSKEKIAEGGAGELITEPAISLTIT